MALPLWQSNGEPGLSLCPPLSSQTQYPKRPLVLSLMWLGPWLYTLPALILHRCITAQVTGPDLVHLLAAGWDGKVLAALPGKLGSRKLTHCPCAARLGEPGKHGVAASQACTGAMGRGPGTLAR